MVTFTQSDVNAHLARLLAARAAKGPAGHIEPSEAEIEPQGMEKALHWLIINWLRLHGVQVVVHSRTDRATTQAKGVADLLWVVHGVPVACEVKVGRNQCTPEQIGWLEAAQLDGWTVGVVRSLAEAIALHNEAARKAHNERTP